MPAKLTPKNTQQQQEREPSEALALQEQTQAIDVELDDVLRNLFDGPPAPPPASSIPPTTALLAVSGVYTDVTVSTAYSTSLCQSVGSRKEERDLYKAIHDSMQMDDNEAAFQDDLALATALSLETSRATLSVGTGPAVSSGTRLTDAFSGRSGLASMAQGDEEMLDFTRDDRMQF